MPQAVALSWESLATGKDGDLLRAVAFPQDRGDYTTLCITRTFRLVPGSMSSHISLPPMDSVESNSHPGMVCRCHQLATMRGGPFSEGNPLDPSQQDHDTEAAIGA
jgi:hypothetical protein